MDEAIAVVAAAQHGVFTAAQARAAGFTPGGIRQRVESGRWIILHRGVYGLAGLVYAWTQQVAAAVLAAGADAAASSLTALALWHLTEARALPIHVSIPARRRCRKDAAIKIHRATLARADVRMVEGIRVTAPNRTLVDVAGALSASSLEAALDTAIFRGLTSLNSLSRYVRDRRLERRAGAGVLRRLIADRRFGVPESELERVFLRKLLASKLPEPTRQFRVGRRRIDMCDPERRVIIELDGHATRYSRTDLQAHERRQNEVLLALPGWTLLRFTRDDVFNDWLYVEATLRRVLQD